MLVDVERESAVIEMAEAAGIGSFALHGVVGVGGSTYGVGELMLGAVHTPARTCCLGLGGGPPTTVAPVCCRRWARVLSMTVAAISRRGSRALNEYGRCSALTPATRVLGRVGAHSRAVRCPIRSWGVAGACGVWRAKGPATTMSKHCAVATAGWSAIVACSIRRLPEAQAGVALPRARGRLARCWRARRRAAGGLGAALLALGAELRRALRRVLNLVGFDDASRCDLVMTGERGDLDEQSATGKAPVGVARRAKRYGKPVVAVVGGRADNLDAVYGQGVDLVLPICRKPMDLERAIDPKEAITNLICAGEAAAQAYDLAHLDTLFFYKLR